MNNLIVLNIGQCGNQIGSALLEHVKSQHPSSTITERSMLIDSEPK